MPKFTSISEVRDEREKLAKDFEGDLPDYLHDFFDSEEMRLKNEEYYAGIRKVKYEKPIEEKVAYKVAQEEEFWKENVGEIVKIKPSIGKHLESRYDPPKRATQRVEDERELTQEERMALIGMCEKDLYLFAVRYFPHYLKKPSSKLHKFLYNTLNREINNTRRSKGFKWAIAAPRSNAKSSIVSGIFPLWCICYNKKKFIIMLSDTADQAKDFLSDVKAELLHNEKLKQDFPHACGKGDVWRLDDVITKNNVKVMALGSGNKIRGRKYGAHRPDLLIFDDLENSDMVRSKTQRDFIRNDWFNKDVMYAGGSDDSHRTDFIVVGTVLGKDSLLNALLSSNEYADWKSRRFQAVESFSTSELWDDWEKLLKNRFDPDRAKTARDFFEEHEAEMLSGSSVLWPDGDPYYNLMIQKVTKPSAFITEKQNSPVDTTKIYITEDQLHWENFKSNPDIKKIVPSRCDFFGAIDPSLGKKSSKGDYSAIVTLARDRKTGYMFVVDINIRRRSVDKQIEEILKLHEKYRYKLFAVETNAFQYVVADTLRKLSRKSGILVPVEEINQYQDKKMRFEGVLPFLLDGTIVFDAYKHQTVQQYALGIEQICTFTGENDRHDDAPDCLATVFEICKKRKFKMITRSTR